jgi:hypothetical protein
VNVTDNMLREIFLWKSITGTYLQTSVSTKHVMQTTIYTATMQKFYKYECILYMTRVLKADVGEGREDGTF